MELDSRPFTHSLWSDTAGLHKLPHQTGQVRVDVCVVGAGITGLTAAQILSRSGLKVALIDSGRIACGETRQSTGHLTEVFDTDYRTLISRFGLDGARLAAHSMRRAIDRIEENVKRLSERLSIDCEFARVPAFRYTENSSAIEDLEEEADAAVQIGIPNELVFDTPLPFPIRRAIRFEHQAQFNPLKYAFGLALDLMNQNCLVFEDTRMIDVAEGEPCRVQTDRGIIIADQVIIAAHVPSLNRILIHSKIAAYRSYAAAFEVPHHSPSSPSSPPVGLFWEKEDPYHHIRWHEASGRSYVIVGGEDHKTGQMDPDVEPFDDLEKWATDRLDRYTLSDRGQMSDREQLSDRWQRTQNLRLSHRWSGQIIKTVDGLPYIGRNPLSEHIYVATGFSGVGMTAGTLAAMILSDLILDHQNLWAELYDARRVKPWFSMRKFVSENLDYPSHLLGDRIGLGDQNQTDLLHKDHGALLQIGDKKVAAYRDSEGEVHLLSPVCPHLGCHVVWNSAAKSWDCPCHGSRFDPKGRLLNGPSVEDLKPETVDSPPPWTAEKIKSKEPKLQTGVPRLSLS